MDSTSRRAYPLDSRAVWVEQQLFHHLAIIPKDNLPLGPGEYNSLPGISRHIGTPCLGKYRGPADHFMEFKSPLSRRKERSLSPSQSEPYSRSSIKPNERAYSPTSSFRAHRSVSLEDPEERSDFLTIFHGNDHRNPYDPNRRFCKTPGPYLAHDPILRPTSISGKQKVQSTVFGPNNVPFGERNAVKSALPDYKVNYDSPVVRRMPRLLSFSKLERSNDSKRDENNISPTASSSRHQNDQPVDSNDQIDEPKSRFDSNSHIGHQNSHSDRQLGKDGKPLTSFEMKCNLVVLPKLKFRNHLKLEFDDSCYRKKGKEQNGGYNVTPMMIDKTAKLQVFQGIYSIPRKHKSVVVQRHQISDE